MEACEPKTLVIDIRPIYLPARKWCSALWGGAVEEGSGACTECERKLLFFKSDMSYISAPKGCKWINRTNKFGSNSATIECVPRQTESIICVNKYNHPKTNPTSQLHLWNIFARTGTVHTQPKRCLRKKNNFNQKVPGHCSIPHCLEWKWESWLPFSVGNLIWLSYSQNTSWYMPWKAER